jgi:hypothetical protein
MKASPVVVIGVVRGEVGRDNGARWRLPALTRGDLTACSSPDKVAWCCNRECRTIPPKLTWP